MEFKVKVKLKELSVIATTPETTSKETNTNPSAINEQEFPTLRVARLSGTVVLFKSKDCGTVLSAGTSHKYKVGDNSTSWTDCNSSAWKKLPVGSKVSFTIKE